MLRGTSFVSSASRCVCHWVQSVTFVSQDEIPYYQRPKIQDPRLWPRCSRMTASQASNLDLKVQLSVLAAFYVGRCNSILAWPYVNLIPPLFRNTLPPISAASVSLLGPSFWLAWRVSANALPFQILQCSCQWPKTGLQWAPCQRDSTHWILSGD